LDSISLKPSTDCTGFAPRKFLISTAAFANLLLTATLSLAGPLVTTLAFSGLLFTLICLLSPVGVVVVIALFSHISAVPGIDFDTMRLVKWCLVGSFLVITLLRAVNESRSQSLRFGALEKYFLLFALWGFVCTIVSIHFSSSLESLMRICSLLLIYEIAVFAVRSKRHVYIVLLVLLVAVLTAVIPSFSGLLQGSFHRFRGLQNNANSFAIFLNFTIPVLVAAAFIFRQKYLKAIFGVVALIAVAALILSWSRSAWIALFVQAFVFLILERKKKLLISLTILCLAAMIFVVSSPTLREIAYKTGRIGSGTTRRALLWQAGWEQVKDSPVFGIGFELKAGDVSEFARWGSIQHVMAFGEYSNRYSAHNLYLKMMLALGLPGLLFAVGFFYILLRQQVRYYRQARSPANRVLVSAVLAIIVGAIFTSFFESGVLLGAGTSANYFWLVLGTTTAIFHKKISF